MHCVSQCSYGYFRNDYDNSCYSCHSDCSKCYSHGNFNCLVCSGALVFSGNACVAQCNQYAYAPNSNLHYCASQSPCKHEHCSLCTYLGQQCLECQDNYVVDVTTGRCELHCNPGFHPWDGICVPCSDRCLECDEPNSCTKCNSAFPECSHSFLDIWQFWLLSVASLIALFLLLLSLFLARHSEYLCSKCIS